MVAVSPPTVLSLPRETRPSLRVVAKLAGVSAMTVSRVLREHPKVSPRVRERVWAAARAVGYRPDPNVAKLMYHLRQRRKPVFQASICALTTRPRTTAFDRYSQDMITGAQRQAEARGYGFTIVSVADEAPAGLQRMLRSRGVEGLMVLPLSEPDVLSDLLDWSEFSIVATTSSLLAPEVHSVMPHHFKNTQLLCRQLNARGYRRIGLVLNQSHVERVGQTYPAAMAWHGMFHAGAFVAPLLYAGAEPRGLAEWFEHEKPDAIVTHTGKLCERFAQRLGLELPGRIGFASTNTTPEAAYAGIDELPLEIGATAVDLLTSMVQRGEKGVPLVPGSTLLRGRWIEGRSCPPRPMMIDPHPAANRVVYVER